MFGAIGMIFGSLLGRLIGMLLLIAIGIAVCIVYYVIAARAAMYENVVLFGVPTLPYLFLYSITIDIPLFGGGDWLNVVGIDAEHEIIKLFLVGLPIFFFVAFYLQWKSKIPPLYSLMYSGVSIEDPETAYISSDAIIGKDTIIRPNVHIFGKCNIGPANWIGPDVTLTNVNMGENNHISYSTVENLDLGNGEVIGPFEVRK